MSVLRFRAREAGSKAVLLLALAACSPRERRPAAAGIDDFGDSIVIAARPRRIVSLSPATTEILFALGAGPRLVGRTHWDAVPAAALTVPDLGDGIRPNVEAILAARPDLVVLYASEENRAAAAAVRAAGVRVVTLRMNLIAEFRRATTVLGALVGEDSAARVVTDSVTRTLERVRAATRALPQPAVFMPAYQTPLLTIGGGSFLSELVTIAGGRNVFEDFTSPSPQISFEEVLRRNPDVMLTNPSVVTALQSEPRWRALPAWRAGRVLIWDTLLVTRPGVKLGEAAVALARLLHPGVLP